MIIRILLLTMAEMAMSTAVIMLKASTESPFLVASYRLLLASFFLSPFFFKSIKENPSSFGWRQISWSALPAVALAVHFISWVYAARMTPVANASLLVNLTPVVLPFLLWFFYREKVTRAEVIGTVITISGVLMLTVVNLMLDPENFFGEMVTIGSMFALACYMALGRRNSQRINLWLYLVPLYFMAGLLCFATACFFVNPLKSYSAHNLLLILGLAVIPTVVGHSVLNYSLKYFRGQVVGVANLSQPVFAGLMGFLIFDEKPEAVFYAAALVIFLGIIIVIRQKRQAS